MKMLSLLDRYIIRIFLSFLATTILAFIAIYFIVDVFEHLDDFVDKKASLPLVIQYYLYYVPYIVVLILPIAMLLSTLFCIGQLNKYHELTAMRANGISLYRTLAPLFFTSLCICVLIFIWGDFVMPYTNEKKEDIMQHQIKKRPRESRIIKRDVYIQDSFRHIFYIKTFNSKSKRGDFVTICKYADNVLINRIDAKTLLWKNEKWILKNGVSRTFEDSEEKAEEFKQLEFMNTDLTFKDIVSKKKKPEEMNYFELNNHIHKIKRSGQDPQYLLVDLYLKISFPLANFIIVFFAAPLMTVIKRGGTSKGFGLSIFICFTYYGLIRIGQALGQNGSLPAPLAAWLANALYGITGLVILYKVPK